MVDTDEYTISFDVALTPGVAGPATTPPSITNMLPMSTAINGQNSAFNVASGGSSLSNNLVVYGTSVYGAGNLIAVFLNGVQQGTTVTTGGGAWSYALGIVGDATYTFGATITVGSSTSLAATFPFTVNPNLTNLPVAIGQNLPPTISNPSSLFNIGADVYEIQNASTNSIATVVEDTHTLHFTITPSDNWNGFNRDEVSGHMSMQNGQIISISYEFWLDAGSSFDQECLVGQVHENNTTSTTPVLYGMAFWPQRPDSPTWQYNHGGSGGNQYTFIQNQSSGTPYPPTGLGAIPRGVWHTIDIIMAPILNTPSTLQIWVDGTKYAGVGTTANVTDFQASDGSVAPPFYWKFGMYRGTFGTPTQDQTQSMRYRNMLVSYV